MTQNDDVEKVARFQTALDQLIERVAEDRYVLAIVLVGSLSPETIWHRETLGLWIIEADGVSRCDCRATVRTNGYFVSWSRTVSTFTPKVSAQSLQEDGGRGYR